MSVLATEAAPIILTREYVKGPLARAVPGAYFDGDVKAWVLGDPSPRAAVVALKLFPGLEHDYPELVELRASALQNARPLDYPSMMGLRANAPRVRAAIAERGWSLHDYQELDIGYGLAWMHEQGGYILGWDRGLGKTIGTCMVMDELKSGANLVIAPNAAKSVTWEDELRALCPWLEVLVLPNDKPKRERMLRRVQELYDDGQDFVLVVHYEALAVIAGKTGKTPGKGRVKLGDGWKRLGIVWDLVAADEGHRFANSDSLQSRAARKVPAVKRLLLSGSIYQNAWEEVYGLLHWTYPKTYTSKWRDWNDRFIDYVDNGYGKICVGILPHRVEDMRDELGRMMAYRTKTPLAQKHTETVELSGEQRRVYDDLVSTCLAQLADGTTVKAQAGIAMLGKLRMIATGLDLLGDVADSTKLDRAERVIDRYLPAGHDFVVACWYKASVYALERRLAARGIECWTLTGDTPKADRDDAVRRFAAGERRVFIGTIATMGESLNLQRANHVVRIDRAWNPALNQQTVDRVDRQGNPRPDDIHLTDIIAAGTVDQLNVMPNLANKQALAAAILGEI